VLSLDEAGGLPLGLVSGPEYEATSVPLEPGDLLLLYTDGITEAMPDRSSGEIFGTTRLDQTLLACGAASPKDCLARVRSAIADYSEGAPPNDDQTLIAMRVL
jgi:sigma-B regulation protein RsbU (phosphoserine phosphatase)